VIVGGVIATTIAVERLTRPYRSERHTPDQEALVDLAKEAKNKGGVSEEEAKTLVDWGKEVGFPGSRGPEVHDGRPFGQKPHIHVGPVNHIPVCSK
jgi:hypothetical protein